MLNNEATYGNKDAPAEDALVETILQGLTSLVQV